MLYLFGQLALSDSLFYHEDCNWEDYPAAKITDRPDQPAAGAQPVEASPRHREHPRRPADRPATPQPR